MNRAGWALLFGAALVLLATARVDAAPDRSARKIVREFDAVEYPGFMKDISMEDYGKLVDPPSRKQCELAAELYRSHPGHKQVPRLMRSRWTLLVNVFEDWDRVLQETDFGTP